jgi:RNA polymerase sigma-70 factor (ECF subfamily)
MGRRAHEGDDLVRSARRGESWALTAIWHQHSAAVVAYLRGRGVGDPEDVTSEVFLQVFGRIERFRGDETDLRTFIFSVAHARYVDDRRRVARRGVDVELVADHHDRPAPSAESDALAALATERVKVLLAALAPDQRDVLLLRIVADLSLEQTADVLGKSVGAVKSLQHRGLAALRPILGLAVSP